MMSHIMLFYVIFFPLALAKNTYVQITKVFIIDVHHLMFNWTYEGTKDQFIYQASLQNLPDLPSWIHFVYSDKYQSGYLFGVPPNKNKAVFPLEIIGLNKRDYETKIEHLNIVISEKFKPAKYEVHMKIVDLNVEDMFHDNRMDVLKNIFKKHLWRDSEDDLYFTFLNSAVEMGARKPLNPSEGEGVIVRLGSQAPFSSDLRDLQDEVRPLYKMSTCPKKKTSVERFFKEFKLDWCSFKLLQKDDNNSAKHQSHTISTDSENLLDFWQPVSRSDIPRRTYISELLVSIIVPIIIMVILALILSFILCFHHSDLIGLSEDPFSKHCSTIQANTHTLGIFANNREINLSPDPMLLSRSHTNSPTSTISRGMHCRPSPPPYVRPKYKPKL